MTKKEKLDKITKDFSLLPEEKQDHILGVLQALVYAHDFATIQSEIISLEAEKNTVLE